MKTKVTIMGCGSSMGVPRPDGYWGKCDPKNKKNYRTRCSLLITQGKNNILIDTSPDLRSQLLSNNVKNVSYVLYTHKHGDQTHGINDLRVFYIKSRKKLDIFANKETIAYLYQNFTYLFNGNFEYPPILRKNKVKKRFSLGLKNEKIYFRSFEVKHGNIFSLAYVFKKVAYISDCSFISKKDFKNLFNLNMLIIDCLWFRKHCAHFNYDEVIKLINILKPKKTILTNMHADLDYKYLKKKVPKNVFPAYDGMKLYV